MTSVTFERRPLDMTMNDFLHQLRWGEESSCICGTTRWAMIENDKEKEKEKKKEWV